MKKTSKTAPAKGTVFAKGTVPARSAVRQVPKKNGNPSLYLNYAIFGLVGIVALFAIIMLVAVSMRPMRSAGSTVVGQAAQATQGATGENDGGGSVPDSCVDTDGGKNIWVKGKATGYRGGKPFNYWDACTEKARVREYYCDGAKIMSSQLYCPKGATCKEGACVNQTTGPANYKLESGETNTFIVGNAKYDVTADTISLTGASFTVNGKKTTMLQPGTSSMVIDGLIIKLNSISSDASSVTFTLEKKPSATCADSDGKDPTTLGYISGSIEGDDYKKYDTCVDTNTVDEYYCEGNQPRDVNLGCKNGYTCDNGKCTKQATPSSKCGDLACTGSELVTCDEDCAFINVKNDDVVVYDLAYDTGYPGTLHFKVWNFADPIPLNDLHVAFAGNGKSCNVQGRGYLRNGIVEQGVIPHHNGVDDYMQLSVRGSQPLFADNRHCNNPIRLGLYTGNPDCGQEKYIAIVNTVLKCT